MLTSYLAVVVGSALGGVARHWVNVAISRHSASRFPWGTLVVNVTGAWLAGFLVALFAEHQASAGAAHLLLIVGFCGAYTTVSSFSLQTLEQFRDGDVAGAIGNVAASALGTLAGAAIGLWLGARLA